MANFIRHAPCPQCGSSDNLAIYDDGSHYCFSGCGNVKPSKDLMKGKAPMEEIEKKSKPVITEEQKEEVKQKSGYLSENYRGIRSEIYKKFGVRHSVSDADKPLAQYYPVTQEGELVGYKIRELPKHFGGSIGRTGSECELFGQFMSKKSAGKFVIITEGEIDAMSAYQMINDYNKQKGWDVETPVVSPTIGSNCKKQIAGQYEFFKKFEKIYISFDNDEAGQKVIDDLISVLPKGKVYVMKTRFKDANEFLKNGKEKEYIQDFWDAKKHMPVGVVGSGSIMERIMEQVSVPKIEFPPSLLPELNEMLGGGIPLGHIVNIAAKTGAGKTTLVNEFIYYWLFSSPHKVGVVSMELDTAQYGEVLLSRHLRRKLAKISDIDAKLDLLNTTDVKTKANELFLTDEGLDRFYLLDNRDGSIDEIKATVEELVVSCGCKVIVLDPVQDILAGLGIDEQEKFMQWMKGFIKSHQMTFILINHVRKGATGSDDEFTEEDIQGSSTIIKSASINLLLFRDKTADDPITRNTTKALLSKNRVVGDTGPAGEIYYDNDTHSLYNKDEFFKDKDVTPMNF